MTRFEPADRLEEADPQSIPQRADDVRLALLLTYITLGWMTIEAAASLLLGWVSKSLLLEAFGIDSIIELFISLFSTSSSIRLTDFSLPIAPPIRTKALGEF